jgi:acetolactate synthase-1/3 small subunit
MQQTISLYVENKAGVLARIAGLLSARGFNIESLTVAKALEPGFSLMTVVVDVEEALAEQVFKQLSKLVNVVQAVDLTPMASVQREMMLVKVYVPDEMRSRLLQEAEIFRARVVDAAPGSFTLEATGDSEKLEALLRVLEAYGRLEMARTGTVALVRGTATSKNGNSAKAARQPKGGPILI